MAIKNNRIFGLSVPLSLADVISKTESLLNLGINKEDLELIRGIFEAEFDKQDLQTISNLSVPVWKSFDRYINDVLTYENTLTLSGGSDFQLRGNLHVAGGIGSTAFRYKILDVEPDPQNPNATPVLKWGDISTSRVSSWSTIGTNISYGGDVEIGGTLKVGKIKTRTVATTKIFDSEVPTHRIKINLNGQTKYIYAMKGIPLKFSGYFRNFVSTIDFVPVLGKKVSWRIRRDDGLTSPEDFSSYGGNTQSRLDYRSPFSAQRTVEVYYSPDAITKIQLDNTNIRKIPRVRLNNLKDFRFNNNGVIDFPDLNFFSPNLTYLNISSNPFYNASEANERRLNQLIVDKLPDSLTYLDLRGCFLGGIEQGIFGKFTKLKTLIIPRTSNVYFYPDSTNLSGELPFFYGTSDPNTHELREFNVSGNDFRTIGSPTVGSNLRSVKQLEKLVTLNLFDNLSLLDNNFELVSNDIVTVDIGRTRLSCPNLQSRPSLRSISLYQNLNAGSLFIGWDGTGSPPVSATDAAYKFANCGVLEGINFYSSTISGYIPKFSGNASLTTIDFRGCDGLIAGRPGQSTVKCLYNDTFDQARKVSSFLLSVNNPNFAGEIDRNTFVPLNSSLQTLYLFANGRFTGAFPDLEGCEKLVNIRSEGQGWGTSVENALPAFTSSVSIQDIRLSSNKFVGSISYSNKLSLRYLNVSSNNLTNISSTFNVPNLQSFFASNNKFAGSLPVLDVACPKVERVSLNNNSFSSYLRKSGMVNLPSIKELDLSSNLLSQTAVDNILFDLVDNYNLYPRKSVVVNLRGSNASPSPYPIIYGIVTGFANPIQPTIVNGVFTNLGSVDGLPVPASAPAGYAPIAGTYSNLSTSDITTPPGIGQAAKVTVKVNVTYDDKVVNSIDAANFTAPRNNPSLYKTQRVGTIGSFTAPQNNSALYQTGNVQTIGSFSAPGNTPAAGVTPNYVNGTFADLDAPDPLNPARIQITTSNGQVTGASLVENGKGYTNSSIIRLTGYTQTVSDTTYTYEITIPVTAVYDESPGYFNIYTAGTFEDQSSGFPENREKARVQVVLNASGYITAVNLVSGGTGYSTTDTIFINPDITIPISSVYDENPAYFGYYPANANGTVYNDTSPPAGGSAASIAITTNAGGYIQSVSLSPSGGPSGKGYSVNNTIDVLGDVSVKVTGVTPRYYKTASYAYTLNSGGYNHTTNDFLRTSNSISFEINANTNTSLISKGHAILDVASITQKVDTSQFKGVAAVAYLRNVGWTIQVNE
jgi:hypothetical protein